MPQNAIDYSKIIIYKIECNDLNITDCYVGSTTDFKTRKYTHQRRCTNPNDTKNHYPVYKFIRANGGWTNWTMVLVEAYPCDNKLEALKRERYWIKELNATLNKNIPSRTMNEWINDNKDKIKENRKKHYEENKDNVKDKVHQYYQNHKDEVLSYKKIYRNTNKDIIKQKRDAYIKKNSEKIYKKIDCECGGSYCINSKSKHFKTIKHIEYINKIKIEIE